MTPRPPVAVAILILVCGLVPGGILFPYLWTGQWLKGIGLTIGQLIVAGIGLVGGIQLGITLGEGPGSALPLLTMPLGCMAAAYVFSGACAVVAFREHRAAQVAAG